MPKKDDANMRRLLMTTFVAVSVGCAALSSAAANDAAKPKSGREKVLFFVAHPDDNLACAGTLFLMKDLFDIHVAVMTHGERGMGEECFRDGSAKAIRTKEEQAACDMVGATLHWCDEVDGDSYANRDVCLKVANLLKELKPRAVIGMWPLDYHCDHMMSYACIAKAIGIAGMRDVIEFYFMEQSFDSRTFIPAYYVDVTDVMELKREFIRKHVRQNPNDVLCQMEMVDAEARVQRCATYRALPDRKCVERFAAWDGKPQGSRCIFNELPPPKGWKQDWSVAKPSKWTPEGGMK